jgi:UDP-N-acetylmuramate dehydrogenase
MRSSAVPTGCAFQPRVNDVRDSTQEIPAHPGSGAAVPIAAFTTLRLGGPAGRLVTATDEATVLATVRDEPPGGLFVLAGGSNVVVSDAGFPGTVLLLRTSGVRAVPDGDRIRLTVAAGESWDGVVAHAVDVGYSGLECLSGIPGSTGATPIQNVGAYGQEVAETIVAVRVFDRSTDTVVTLAPDECGFAYRTSIFKHNDRYVVLSVEFSLAVSPLSAPIRYAELARSLGVGPGDRVPLADARAAVLALRAGKGMVLDPADPDTYSVGSFFTNPVLPADAYPAFEARLDGLGPAPCWPAPDDAVKVSAAWLIERAGFAKGRPGAGEGVGISTKHTLALTNRGTGSTAALLDLAGEIRAGVRARFGVDLHPEPVLVNCAFEEQPPPTPA